MDSSKARSFAVERLLMVYGDSLSLPRVLDNIAVAETYTELLAEHLTLQNKRPRIYHRGEGGRTINDHWQRYLNDRNFFKTGENDILIIHAGMVDCAPRPLPLKWRRRLERQPAFIQKPIVSFIKNNRPWLLKKGFIFYKTDPALFKQRIEEWLDQAATHFSRVVVIAMPPIGQAAEDFSPGWRENIVLYNGIMAEAAARHRALYVPLHEKLSQDEKLWTKCVSPLDGYHLLKPGHRLIFEFIASHLD
jgi:lysophospholipase L1-like esterase